MPSFKNSQSHHSQILARIARPRLLRAIPSLVLLTTAMAWGASSHAGGLGLGGAVHGATGVSVAAGPTLGGGTGAAVGVGLGLGANTAVQPGGGVANAGVGLDAGVRAGANGNVMAEERTAATGAMGSAAAGAQAGGEVKASGAVNSAIEDVGRVSGGVRDTGQTVGSAAARTGKRVAPGVKGEVTSGVKSGAGSVKVDAAGGQGVTTAR